MRIGIDGRLWNETGVGRYIRNLVWELQDLDKENEYTLFVKKRFNNENLKVKNDNWNVVETDIHWHSVDEQLKFPQVLNQADLDLMHFTYFSLPIFYNKPFVVTIHDLIVNHFPTGKASTLPYPLYRLKRVGYDVVMNQALKNSKKIIVPLNAVKDDIMQTFGVSGEKIGVTYEGISNLKTQNSKLHLKSQKYFLYVGNAYPHKNLEFLIEAFIEFRKTIKDDVGLILVGKDDFFYKRLHSKIEKEKIENIIFKHDVSDEELFNLYSHAIAFISASKMEGFGLPPLEAMSAQCPVILSDIPSFREVCSDSGFYFDLESKASLLDRMKYLTNLDKKIKDQHLDKGLERVKIFSWEKMAKQTLSIYENCL